MIYGRSGAISEQWHFLNNIVSSQSSYQRKQDALGHTLLTALQIVYACDAIVRSLWGFVVYNIGSEHPKGEMAVVEQCDPPEGEWALHLSSWLPCGLMTECFPPSVPPSNSCCRWACGVYYIAAYPIFPSSSMDNFTPQERTRVNKCCWKEKAARKEKHW